MDNLDSSSSSKKTYSGSESENENPEHGKSKVEEPKQTSRQLQYYHRKTGARMKRKYTPFRDQENPSRQLKRYHGIVEACSTLPASMDTAGSVERMSETDINEEMQIGTTVEIQNEEKEISPDNFEDKAAFNTSTTSSSGEESDIESSSDSEDSVSETESEQWDNEPEEMVPERENETTLPEEEKPLYQGSTILKILSCVLIVSFVLKHNLSKAAWADLLRLLTALLGDRCRQTFQSVYKMKVIMKEYFGSREPTKINYCTDCLQAVKADKCPNAARQDCRVF